MDLNDSASLGIALALGLLVGLQRQSTGDPVAGIRTFPLVALLGGFIGILGREMGGWIAAAGLLACAALLVMANAVARSAGRKDVGLTTEFSLMLMFVLGLALAMGHRLEPIVCAGAMMALLQFKRALHGAVRRIDEKELMEIARLALAGLVILPLLPNQDMGYRGVFNPFEVWLLVVLISGVSMIAYLAGKFIGGTKGAVLAGVLGGLISSTATTVGAARQSKNSGAGPALAVVALVASAVVFGRVIVEMILAAPEAWGKMIGPILAMMAWCAAVAWIARLKVRDSAAGKLSEKPPSELKGAIIFTVLYVAVLYGVAFAKERLGDVGLYAVAIASGLTDMDAITISASKMVAGDHVSTSTGWRLIISGGMANLFLKGVMVAILGSPEMRKITLAGFGASMIGGGLILALWPG
ncbi:MAG: DUF4010 domain-containing protein [Verrucomicrobiota bacterium]